MKGKTTLRGYVAAALAMAVCVATWAAVVRADTGVARALGVHREEAGRVCMRVLETADEANPLTKRPGGPFNWCYGR